jgi:hypothetical protein
LVGIGIGLSAIGALYEEAGLEGLGEAFNVIGKGITFVGSALAIIIPLIPVLGKVFIKTGEDIQKAGFKALSGWAWAAIVIVAIMALMAIVAVIIKAVNKNSPEK